MDGGQAIEINTGLLTAQKAANERSEKDKTFTQQDSRSYVDSQENLPH